MTTGTAIVILALIVLCLYIAYRLGVEAGKREAQTIEVQAPVVNIQIDLPLIYWALLNSGFVISKPKSDKVDENTLRFTQ